MSKTCTNLEQSKKLAEILPLESADMRIGNYVGKSGTVDGTNIHYYPKGESFGAPEIIYAWSLAALLDVLPKICYPVKDHPTYLTLGKPKDKWCALYWDTTGMQDGEQTLADNPVDACVEMIIKLHDQKLL